MTEVTLYEPLCTAPLPRNTQARFFTTTDVTPVPPLPLNRGVPVEVYPIGAVIVTAHVPIVLITFTVRLTLPLFPARSTFI